MIIVSDTTAISNLFKLGKLHYLKSLFEKLVIPAEVFRELVVLKEFGYNLDEIENSDWISVLEVKKSDLLIELSNSLDLGEAEAIVLSIQIGTDFLLIDEKKGRLEAERLGVKTIGILGVLIQCRKSGICFDLKTEMEDLKTNAGFWIGEKLFQEILEIEKKLLKTIH